MFKNLKEVEDTILNLEQSVQTLSEGSIFDQMLNLRNLALSSWVEDPSGSDESSEISELKDRITEAEQRILEIASRVPACSVKNIYLKLSLWMLDRDLPNLSGGGDNISDDLIVSIYRDLSHLAARLGESDFSDEISPETAVSTI